MKFYRAPWGKSLVTNSLLGTAICVGVALCPNFSGSPGLYHLTWGRVVPVLLAVGAAFFMVRGYTITPTEVLIHRLGWTTRLALAGLETARIVPGCLSQTLRLWGNGGLYSFTGIYSKQSIGRFRAFVTDGQRTVVLRFPGKTVVVSPDDPEGFAQTLTGFCR